MPYIRVLQHVTQTSWKAELEALIPIDAILREDPARAYGAMTQRAKNIYRESVARLAQRSDRTELEVAKKALTLARQAQRRHTQIRGSHAGVAYRLLPGGGGRDILTQRVGYHATAAKRMRVLAQASR